MSSEIPPGWSRTTVGEWAPFGYGKGLPKRDRRGGHVPVYGSNGVVGWHDESFKSGPGVVIGRKGTVGSVNYSACEYWPIDTTYFVESASHHDLRFVAALLGTLGLEERNSHSAVPGLNRADAHQIPIVVPPIDEQRAIAEILGSLDDRIQWCRLTAQRCLDTLSAVASGGSRVVKVSQLAEFVNGGAFTKDAAGDGRLIIKISELNSGVSASSKFSDVDAPPNRVANTGDVLFSWSATLDVFRWTGEQALINQHIFKVIPSKGVPLWLVYAKLAEVMPAFQKIAADRATTMGHIKKAHLEQVTVDLADAQEMATRNEAGTALWEQHLELSLQANAVERTRVALLPELMSGRLRVKDVDGFLERAGLS